MQRRPPPALSPSPLAAFQPILAQHEPLDAEQERVIARRLQAGDRTAGEQLIRSNLPFVLSIARQYRHWGLPLEDLVQEGCIGLLRAASRFDPEHGCRLVTYAGYWIRAEIREYVVRTHRLVRVGTTKGERRAIRWFRRTGELDPDQLAAKSGLSVQRAERLLPILAGRDVPLEARSASGRTPADWLPADEPGPEDQMAVGEAEHRAARLVHDLLAALPARERTIVRRRWLDDTPATLAELGAAFGISKERVRQLEQRTLERLRAQLEGLSALPLAG